MEGDNIIAGVMPGRVVVEARPVEHPSAERVRLTLELTPYDGEILQLEDPVDRSIFVRAFTGIALTADPPPSQVGDCSAFLRYAFTEALRGGFEGQRVGKYQLPWTPLGQRVFQTPAGRAEFADADTLRRLNTFFRTRDIRHAEPGDLLFFRQTDQKSPFHAMIVAARDRVAYHTGPIGRWPGEIRRPTIGELLRHELPRWRPLAENPNFLGVFRWNILKQDP